MGREQLSKILNRHLNSIHETLQVLDQTPPSSLDKIKWEEVIQIADQVSKQATVVGMLWNGETPQAKALEENMTAYFNALHGFLLLSHGSTVGAGPTLSSMIHASVKKVVDCSFLLMKESILSYGSRNKDHTLSIPQLVGTVWDACSAVKKTPSTNIIAIGRAMTQTAVSVKDVFREMKELKPASLDPTDSSPLDDEDHDNSSSEGDLGNDLSPEEMKVAQSATRVVTETLVVIKELIRSITGLLKQETQTKSSEFVDSLEKLLKLCQEIGVVVDEIGACLYPPQEVPAMNIALDKMSIFIDQMKVEVESHDAASEAFVRACDDLKDSIGKLVSDLDCVDADNLVPEMQKLEVNN